MLLFPGWGVFLDERMPCPLPKEFMLSWSRFDLGLTLCSLLAPMDGTTPERLLESNTMRLDAHTSEIVHRVVRGKSIEVSWLR